MEVENLGESYLQVRFVSKQKELNLPKSSLDVPSTSSTHELNALLKSLCKEEVKSNYDFLIRGHLLRAPLNQFYNDHNIESEGVVEIECVLEEPAPSPHSSIPHEDWVGAVVGHKKCIISGSYDNCVSVWSRKDSSLMCKTKVHSGPIKCLALLDNKVLCGMEEEAEDVVAVACGSQDQTLSILKINVKERKVNVEEMLKEHERSVDGVCSSPFHPRIASGGHDGLLKIWNYQEDGRSREDGEKEDSQRGNNKKRKIQSPDENRHIKTKTPMVTLGGHKEGITGVDWSTEAAEVVTAGLDQTIIIWDLELAGQKGALNGSKAFTSLSVSPSSGLILTGSADRNVRLWDPKSKEGSMVKQVLVSHTGWISDVQWSRNKEELFISSSYDGLLKMWDIRSPKASLYDMSGHEDRILCCDWSEADIVLSGSCDNTLKSFVIN